MLRVMICALVWVLAFYGFVQLLVKTAAERSFIEKRAVGTSYAVMAVKNRAEDIETLIRAEAWRMLCADAEHRICDMVIIDLESEDETWEILKNLAREYDFVHPMSRKRYIEMIENM